MKIRFSSALAFIYASVVGIFFGNVAISSVGNKTFVSSNSNVVDKSVPVSDFKVLDDSYLIAASTQLNNLLYNSTYRYNNTVRYYKITAPDHSAAYATAWYEFNNIIDIPSLKPPAYTTIAGWVYTGNLKGGGTANLREYGSSIQTEPTIDILNHYTATLNGQTFSQVREVKFPYIKPLVCPASTTSC